MTFHEAIEALRTARDGLSRPEGTTALVEAACAVLAALPPAPEGEARLMGVWVPRPYEHPTRVEICHPTCPLFNNGYGCADTAGDHDMPGPGCPWEVKG